MRLIDLDEAKKRAVKVTIYDEGGWDMTCMAIPEEELEKLPTIEAEPVRHGHWNIIEWDKENKRVMVECDCGAVFKLSMFDFGLCYNYCPSCGARQIEEKEEC